MLAFGALGYFNSQCSPEPIQSASHELSAGSVPDTASFTKPKTQSHRTHPNSYSLPYFLQIVTTF